MAHAPQSTVFGKRKEPHTVIIARGDSIRHFTIRPWVVTVAGSACAAIAVGYLLATSYLVLRDNLIGASVTHQARMQQAYEDRISALRSQVDRITSRQLLDQRAVEQKVSELLARQSLLTQQHGRLGPLLERAERLEKAASIPLPSPRPDQRASADEASSAPAPDARTAGLRTGGTGPAAHWNTRLALAGDGTSESSDNRLLATINTSLRSIETEQLQRVQALSQQARETGDAVKDALQSAGLEVAANYGKEDVGGPLIEVNNPSKFDRRIKELDHALDQLDLLKAEIRKVPIANPAPGAVVTSGFGFRSDPILGVSALHPGIDFRDAVGSNVPATAAGVVTRAGRTGGYGNMVEIDHGGGYSTRYAHLSEIDVKIGEKVALGQTIGKSGSTGRSTGPHLHYEVRHNGKAVNPVSFLKAGRVVSQLL